MLINVSGAVNIAMFYWRMSLFFQLITQEAPFYTLHLESCLC